MPKRRGMLKRRKIQWPILSTALYYIVLTHWMAA